MNRARFLLRCLRLLGAMVKVKIRRDSASQFQFVDAFLRINPDPILRKLREDPKSAALIEARDLSFRLTLAQLQACPEGSLGWSLLHGLDDPVEIVDLYEYTPEITGDIDYIVARVRSTHDLHHVVTGFDRTIEGEMGLAIVYFAQMYRYLSVFFFFGLFLREFRTGLSDVSVAKVFNAFTVGWRLGRTSGALFPVDWQVLLDQPLEEVREKLHIQPVDMTDLEAWFDLPRRSALRESA